jgi:hypothetical protein
MQPLGVSDDYLDLVLGSEWRALDGREGVLIGECSTASGGQQLLWRSNEGQYVVGYAYWHDATSVAVMISSWSFHQLTRVDESFLPVRVLQAITQPNESVVLRDYQFSGVRPLTPSDTVMRVQAGTHLVDTRGNPHNRIGTSVADWPKEILPFVFPTPAAPEEPLDSAAYSGQSDEQRRRIGLGIRGGAVLVGSVLLIFLLLRFSARYGRTPGVG